MKKEQLRMQMLAGVITEGEYKAKLNEQPDTDFVKSEMERHISMVNDNPEINDQEKKRRIDNIRFVVYDFLDPNTNGGKRPPSDFQFDDNWWNSTPSDINKFVIDDVATDLVRAAKGNSFGENDVPLNEKDSLNENFVGMAAINNPFAARKKETYEDAFEHFLSERYETKFENREQDLEEDKDPDVYESENKEVNEGFLDNFLSKLEQNTGILADVLTVVNIAMRDEEGGAEEAVKLMMDKHNLSEEEAIKVVQSIYDRFEWLINRRK
jgi:hypothetical protein